MRARSEVVQEEAECTESMKAESRLGIEYRGSFVMHLLAYQEKSCGHWSVVIGRQSFYLPTFRGVERTAATSDVCPDKGCLKNTGLWQTIGQALTLMIVVDPFDSVVFFGNSKLVNLVSNLGRQFKKGEDALAFVS